MNLLVLGGTRFLGRALVESAIDRAYDVTLFNRGVHGRDLFPGVRRLWGDRNIDVAPLEAYRWDAVVDTCAYLPGAARLIAEVLGGRVRHYTFISSMAVYRGHAERWWTEELVVQEANAADVAQASEVEVGEVAGQSYGRLYGPLKMSCERVIGESFGKPLIVRPGLVVGPWDFGGDRFAYWPRRVREGGEVLAPGRHDAPLQLIDVRDLAVWILDMIEQEQVGTFNAVGPEEPLTMAGFLELCRGVTCAAATFTWVEDNFLVDKGLGPAQIPLWAPATGEPRFTASNRRALSTGLYFRPLTETIADTLTWEQDHPQPISLSRERERQLLLAWHATTADT
jgi:2'-hydroxyisoflavone reductase